MFFINILRAIKINFFQLYSRIKLIVEINEKKAEDSYFFLHPLRVYIPIISYNKVN